MMRNLVVGLVVVLFISGCAVTKTPQPTGGSKSDGIVHMSYEAGSMEQVTVDKEGARKQALERCKAWGYSDVEAFGGERRKCQSSGTYGCNRYFVTIPYQCVDSGKENSE